MTVINIFHQNLMFIAEIKKISIESILNNMRVDNLRYISVYNLEKIAELAFYWISFSVNVNILQMLVTSE